jgi:hypothetical protein
MLYQNLNLCLVVSQFHVMFISRLNEGKRTDLEGLYIKYDNDSGLCSPYTNLSGWYDEA